jgi:hypothetical protein
MCQAPPLVLADSCLLDTSEGRVNGGIRGEYPRTHNVFYEILLQVLAHEIESACPLGN